MRSAVLIDLRDELREVYKTQQDNMPLARLIARIEAHDEEGQVLLADAREFLKRGHIR